VEFVTDTKIDELFKVIEKSKKVFVTEEARNLNIPVTSVSRIARYFEQLGLVELDFKNIKGPSIIYIKSPQIPFRNVTDTQIIEKLDFYKSVEDIKSVNKLVYNFYEYAKNVDDQNTWEIYRKVREYYMKTFINKYVGKGAGTSKDPINKIDSYTFTVETIQIKVDIVKQELEAVPFYVLSLLKLSDITKLVIERIQEEVIGDITMNLTFKSIEEEFFAKNQYKQKITEIMKIVLPDIKDENLQVIADYVVITSLGMGDVEFLLKDKLLEEIVINSSKEPVWAYHKKHGWLQTDITVDDEARTVHYAMLAGRVVDKTITTLEPLMDAHLKTGDRVNATLMPISSRGNTFTIRKFAEQPWTITSFLKSGTIDTLAAAIVWTAMQYELSILIVGGTGSGKTSTLNVLSLFIPPNQRVISIEDTRELQLPKTLHWVPMETKLPNPEGKGGVSMLDLCINSLRMRPDRIIVGEIRRKKEAEVMFEAMHTGHSVYATLHANTAKEAVVRLTTDPIGISKSLLNAVDLIFVQNRNRRTNKRRTFEIAEVLEDGELNVLFRYSVKEDKMIRLKAPEKFYAQLELVAGLTKAEVNAELRDKIKILNYLVSKDMNSVEEIALLVKNYYVNKTYLMNKLFGDKNK
jgi:archaeal flagellar protein FlaI